jgi:2-keto-4-pentenoate hydratase
MSEFDPTLLGALRVQLAERERRLASGADHVGWKLGVGRRERIGDSIAVGHLTSETLLRPQLPYRARPDEDLHADAEVMIVLGHDLADPADHDEVRNAISSYGAALEIVDLQQRPGEPASVVAGNVFHRAVAMAPLPLAVSADVEAALVVNGAERERGPWPHDLVLRLAQAGELLARVGQSLRAGDRIIMGSIVQTSIAVGDDVSARFGDLGAIELSIAPL